MLQADGVFVLGFVSQRLSGIIDSRAVGCDRAKHRAKRRGRGHHEITPGSWKKGVLKQRKCLQGDKLRSGAALLFENELRSLGPAMG